MNVYSAGPVLDGLSGDEEMSLSLEEQHTEAMCVLASLVRMYDSTDKDGQTLQDILPLLQAVNTRARAVVVRYAISGTHLERG